MNTMVDMPGFFFDRPGPEIYCDLIDGRAGIVELFGKLESTIKSGRGLALLKAAREARGP